MIPQIIHRVWISEDLPDPNTDLGKCFYSQEKLKDYGYEIRTYTNKNFDFSMSKFLLQAYSLKKWAFVTDYIRLWAIYNFGGIYMDADVEVFKPFDDFLNMKYFFGAKYQSWINIDPGKNFPVVNGLYSDNEFLFDAGVFGAEKNNYIIKLLYDFYNNYNFIERDGYIHDKNYLHIGYPADYIEHNINNILTKHNYNKVGFITNKDEYSSVVNTWSENSDIYILNTEFLGDYNYKKHINSNENCICVHYGNGTWLKNTPIYLSEYPKEDQQEYLKRYNDNKLTKLSKNIYIYTTNILNDIKDNFDINDNQIIYDINNITLNYNDIIINYDNITNMQLFKYLLKNLNDYNCITTDYTYLYQKINNITDIKNNLLIKYEYKR